MGIAYSFFYNIFLEDDVYRVVILGIHDAGKTTILCNFFLTIDKQHQKELISTVPSIFIIKKKQSDLIEKA